MHAGAKDPVRFGDVGIRELGETEAGLHWTTRPDYTPAHIRPELSTPLGSKLAFTRFVKAASPDS